VAVPSVKFGETPLTYVAPTQLEKSNWQVDFAYRRVTGSAIYLEFVVSNGGTAYGTVTCQGTISKNGTDPQRIDGLFPATMLAAVGSLGGGPGSTCYLH